MKKNGLIVIKHKCSCGCKEAVVVLAQCKECKGFHSLKELVIVQPIGFK